MTFGDLGDLRPTWSYAHESGTVVLETTVNVQITIRNGLDYCSSGPKPLMNPQGKPR